MALSRFVLIFLLFCKASVRAAIEDIDLKYTQPGATFDELYNDGIRLYSDEKWSESVRSFSLALADYRHEKEVRSNCVIHCREKVDKSNVLKSSSYDGSSLVLYYVIRVRRCADLCQEKFMGRRAPIAKFVRDAFEKREPYNYLQFAYFKLKQYQKASNAAFTYLERHPFEKFMSNNLVLYTSSKYNASLENLLSYEKYLHEDLFSQGDAEYEAGKFSDCVQTFEASLDEYYRAYTKCQALCEFQHEKHQASYSIALFQHYMAIVQCRLDCHDKLAFVRGLRRENFLEDHYHYLQFCYFETGKVKEAAENARAFLLFHPEDPIMVENMKFYLELLKSEGSDILARKRPQKYLDERKLDEKLFSVAKYYANPDVIFQDVADDLNDLENDANLIKADVKHVKEDVQIPKQAGNVISKAGKAEKDSAKKNSKPKKLSKIVKSLRSWQNNPLYKGVKLHKEGKQLNGSERFAVDNMASEKDCRLLSDLVQKLLIKKLGTFNHQNQTNFCEKITMDNTSFDVRSKSRKKLSRYGDGYDQSHSDPKHPFTPKESFEGVNIKEAVEAAVLGDVSLEEAELYANISEKMRHFVADYFQLQQPLYIAFTHLVCRTAYEDAADGRHVSHPIHSDNCILGLDGPNTCPKVAPAYVWRDFSGILYLNDDFEGGDFIFANPDNTVQTSVKPKCGRMVAFSGGIKNLHGVRGIRSGRRCALPLWFTLQGDKIEDDRGRFLKILTHLRGERNKYGGVKASDLGRDIKRTLQEFGPSGSGFSGKSEL